MKSLGRLVYPQATLTNFDGSKGKAELTLIDGGKKIKIELGVHCAKKLVDLAREITAKQRARAMSEWHTYIHLRDYTGYKAPEGDE